MRMPAISQERGNSCKISGTGRTRELGRVGAAVAVIVGVAVGVKVSAGVGVGASVGVRVGDQVSVAFCVGIISVLVGDGVGTRVEVGEK